MNTSTLRKAGNALVNAVEGGDEAEIAEAVTAWRKAAKTPARKKKPDEPMVLAGWVLERFSTIQAITSEPRSTAPHLRKLMAKGVSEDQIRKAVEYVVGPNQQSAYPLVVLSGKALYEKWDKVVWNMNKRGQPKKKEYF